jgi:porin
VWSPKVNGLPGEYRLGYYYSTAKADDVYDDVNGNPQALTGRPSSRTPASTAGGWWRSSRSPPTPATPAAA